MGRKMTWDEMKNNYPEEWLLIVDYDLDESGHLLGGVIEQHSKKKENVYIAPAIAEPGAFRFTSESAYSGLRSHKNL